MGLMTNYQKEEEWRPDHMRVGGHALQSPAFSYEDLIGSGLLKLVASGAVSLGSLLAMMKMGAKKPEGMMYPKQAGAVGFGRGKNLDLLYTDEAKKKALQHAADTYVNMTPDDFLALAHQLDMSYPEAVKTVESLSKVGKFSDVPYLELKVGPKGQPMVSTHEGRHRAMNLKNKGIDEMPVVLSPGYRLRSEQKDINSEDIIEWISRHGKILSERDDGSFVGLKK